MKYIYDHDLHIHSYLSSCSKDKNQNPKTIIKYAEDYNLNTICLTDHFWDGKVLGASLWYIPQNFRHISKAKPLPQSDGIRFLFGCEAEVTKNNVLGISKGVIDQLDFIVIPTNHFHMRGFTVSKKDGKSVSAMAKNWIERLDHVLNMDLPFNKIGIAHLACPSMAPKNELIGDTINAIPTDEMYRLFKKAKQVGVGIELNADDLLFKYADSDIMLKPFRIAKECGCKFYLGSDAHHPEFLYSSKELFEKAIDLLELEETDKIDFLKQ